MQAFDNVAIRVKIPLSFIVMLVIIVLLGILSLDRLSAVETNAEDVRDNWLPSAGQLGKLSSSISDYRVREGRFLLLSTDPANDLTEIKGDLDRATTAFADARKEYEPLIARGTQDE